MTARVLGLIDSPPTRPIPTGESDILHPLLLIFDIRSPSVQRYIPPGVVRRAEGGRIPCEGRPGRRESHPRARAPPKALGERTRRRGPPPKARRPGASMGACLEEGFWRGPGGAAAGLGEHRGP